MTSSPAKPLPIVTVSDELLAARCARGRVVVIDDDAEFLDALASLIGLDGYACETYPSAAAYLDMLAYNQPRFAGPACVLCDVRMPGFSGLELQGRLVGLDDTPLLLMSGLSGATEAVRALHGGALDFLVKPIDAEVLLAALARALAISTERQRQRARKTALAARISSLTMRERDVARRVAASQTNPAIAQALGISLRNVKLHRQHAMEKLGAGNVIELARLADEGGL